jgi:hypothetical protein
VINTISVSYKHIPIALGNGNDNHLQTIRFQIKDKLLCITLYRWTNKLVQRHYILGCDDQNPEKLTIRLFPFHLVNPFPYKTDVRHLVSLSYPYLT